MVIATFLFNIVHPGAVMRGKAADLPSRKERRNMAKEETSTGEEELGQGVIN